MKIDTHIHTKGISGCSKLTNEELVEEYKKNGYDCLFVTNHLSSKNYRRNELQRITNGYKDLKKLGDKNGLKIFFGIELRHERNDYLIYGLSPDLVEKNNLAEMSFIDLKIFCEKYNAVIIQAHPFREKNGKFSYETNINAHGVEVLNGHPANNQHNDKSLEYAIINKKLKTAGSDSHKISGTCRVAMIYDGDIISESHFVQLLKWGKFRLEKYF